MNKFIGLLILLISFPLTAGDLYKCTTDGITSYQHSPCPSDTDQSVIREKKLTKADIDAGEEYEKGISLTPLYVKKEAVNIIGAQWFSYKSTVINNTDSDRKLYIRYKGVDSKGFEVSSIALDGTVKAHSSKELTDKYYLNPDELKRIEKWVLDK